MEEAGLAAAIKLSTARINGGVVSGILALVGFGLAASLVATGKWAKLKPAYTQAAK